MSLPTVYRSDDPSAPVLNGQVGSLITVLKACLVTGYGTKPAAGWTVALEDAPARKIILRNDSVVGSGMFFRVQDNGIVNGDPNNVVFSTPRGSQAAVLGMMSYTNIDTPVNPFPRLMTGGNFHSTDIAYGVGIRKSSTPSNTMSPWVIVADNRTCYIFTTTANINTTALPFAQASNRGIHVFGDLLRLNPANATLPKAVVLGGHIGVADLRPNGTHDFAFVNVGRISEPDNRLYLNSSLGVATRGVQGKTKGRNFYRIGGSCESPPVLGSFMSYPSVGNFGVELNPIFIMEDFSDSIRVIQSEATHTTEIGLFPGLFGCMHTTSALVSSRIGAELSSITHDGTPYIILSQRRGADDKFSELFAVSLHNWWT